MVGYSDSGKDTGYIGSTLGAAQRPGAARQAGGRERHRARALPRPRRLAVARRRAHLPRHPGPARGDRQRAHPHHRAGRDRLGPLRRRRARRAVAGADDQRRAARERAAEPAGPRRVARGDGAAVGALARALPRARLRRPGVPALLRPGGADRRALAAQHRVAAAVAQGRRGRRVAARDPVGLRVDAEPPAAAVLVRRGHGAGRRRPRAAARDVARLAVLPRPDRHARDGALQVRPGRRRALPVAGGRGHRPALLGRPRRRVRVAWSSAC